MEQSIKLDREQAREERQRKEEEKRSQRELEREMREIREVLEGVLKQVVKDVKSDAKEEAEREKERAKLDREQAREAAKREKEAARIEAEVRPASRSSNCRHARGCPAAAASVRMPHNAGLPPLLLSTSQAPPSSILGRGRQVEPSVAASILIWQVKRCLDRVLSKVAKDNRPKAEKVASEELYCICRKP